MTIELADAHRKAPSPFANAHQSIALLHDSRVRDYVALLKPRVMALVLFTACAGMWMAPGTLHPIEALISALCIAGGAGASGAMNMWYDRDIDALMHRTRGRPLPMGRIAPEDALLLGVVLSAFSIMMLWFSAGLLPAMLLAGTIGFYILVYTMYLKRRTPQNIVIGGVAGALPPMIGWSVVTGQIALLPCVMAMIVFFWTVPHSWALAILKEDDYRRAHIPMMPIVVGIQKTKWMMIGYGIMTFLVTLLPLGWMMPMGMLFYALIAIIIGGYWIWTICHIDLTSTGTIHMGARRVFLVSIWYLFIIFASLMITANT